MGKKRGEAYCAGSEECEEVGIGTGGGRIRV